jgi:hypothetical protein
MPERRRNRFERKCRVCGSLGVPTSDGRVMHFGRIATCREHGVVEGVIGGSETVADGLDTATSSIHTSGDVQGAHGQPGRGDSGQGLEDDAEYWAAVAATPSSFEEVYGWSPNTD